MFHAKREQSIRDYVWEDVFDELAAAFRAHLQRGAACPGSRPANDTAR